MSKFKCIRRNQYIDLKEKKGEGGQAEVWKTSLSGYVAKIYSQLDSNEIEKLEVMLDNPPKSLIQEKNYTSIAWVVDLIEDESKKIVGFLMPELPTRFIKIRNVYIPKRRKKSAPGLNWLYLHLIAKNFVVLIQSIHEKNYVVGDINDANIFVDDRTVVAIVDTDSFQLRHPITSKIYRCPVGSREFTPPELIGKDFSKVDRDEVHDRFGLAVLIYRLLFSGEDPFSGGWQGSEDKPDRELIIQRGYWLYSPDTLLKPGQNTVPIEIVHPDLQRLFHRCFTDGYKDRGQRPSAAEWIVALDSAIRDLADCTTQISHQFSKSSGYRKCYWCEGRSEWFPLVPHSSLYSASRLISPLVSLSGEGDYTSISEAIRNVKPGATIRIAPGIYEESIELKKRVDLVGNGDGRQVIIKGSNFACISINSVDETVEIKISKITIQGIGDVAVKLEKGCLEINNCEITSDSSYSIEIYGYQSQAIVRDCKVLGAGILFSDSSHGLVERCNISENLEAGIEIKQNSNPKIRECNIHHGKSFGISIHSSGCGIVENCNIFENGGAGIRIDSQGSPAIKDGGIPTIRVCHIYNGKKIGILISDKGEATVENCYIGKNKRGNWQIERGAKLIQRGNSPQYNPLIHDIRMTTWKWVAAALLIAGTASEANFKVLSGGYFYLWGLAQSHSKDYVEAIANLEQAMQVSPILSRYIKPKLVKDYFNLGIAAHEINDYENAIFYYRQALEIDSSSTELVNNRLFDCYSKRAELRIKHGDIKSAKEDISEAIKLGSKNNNLDRGAKLYLKRGIINYNNGQKQAAISDFNEVIKQRSNEPEAYYRRGLSYYDLGITHWKEASEDFKKVIELGSSDYLLQSYFNRGIINFETQRYPSAIHDFRSVIELDQNNYEAYLKLGDTYEKLGQLDDAIGQYTRLTEIASGYTFVHEKLGDVYCRREESQLDAFHSYNRYLEKSDGSLADVSRIKNKIEQLKIFVNLCNKNSFSIRAALSYFQNEQWISKGWYEISPGQCIRTFETSGSKNMNIYIYGEDNKSVAISSSEHKTCVKNFEESKNFQLKENNNNTSSCSSSDEKIVGMSEFSISLGINNILIYQKRYNSGSGF